MIILLSTNKEMIMLLAIFQLVGIIS